MAIIQSGATADLLTVGPTSKAARAELYNAAGNPMAAVDGDALASQAGILGVGLDHDTLRAVHVNRLGQLEAPVRRMLFSETCEGATVNSQRWTTTATTMAAAQAATGITLNSAAITTINTGVLLTSRGGIYKMAKSPIHARIRARHTLVANQVAEWGLGFMATLSGVTVQVENGAHFRFNSGGTVTPVFIYNSTEVTGSDISGGISSSNYYDYHVTVDDDRAVFQVFSSDTGALVNRQVLRVPITQPKIFAVTHQNVWLRVRNSGSAPASGGKLIVGEVEVAQLNLLHSLPYDNQLAEMCLGVTHSPTAFTQLAQFANNATPTAATLSNTAASYTTLGGLWNFAAVATATTDFCLFGFTVPAPYRLKLFGVRVDMYNTGAANAATPATTLLWGIGVNGASANLSTGGHMRKSLGVTSVDINAAIGARGSSLDEAFPQPIICEPGTNLAIIMRVVAGAATASQVISGTVDVRGVFE